ncbi:hypothetical protein FC752_14345 [Lysinibacillus varians]|uniref:Uncharacterized protein n=1 Tax=Lysinibacillus varians TaxID=1145276 RepID=A0ABY2TCJ2_9BACI|nr:hypothetical protein FC752_14345 [Lysinibacillus varians]
MLFSNNSSRHKL